MTPARLDDDELDAWLRLQLTPGVGRGTARELLARYGMPQELFAQPRARLRADVGEALATVLADEPPDWPQARATLHDWLGGDACRRLIPLGDAAYPAGLLQTADPPLLLYAQGRTEWLASPSVAIVGSRNPTAQGLEHARTFAKALGDAGYTIVSGLALGIDGAAHEGGLASPCSTIAVIGTGLDRIYPARHEQLARRIVDQGLMLSELPLGTHPLRENFPQRNRIIAGLTRGTLVVEAALQSGSLITARMASECGREVFAIPGSIHAPQSRGCHALIKQGAKLVENADDVLDELHRSFGRERPATTRAHSGTAPADEAPVPPSTSRARDDDALLRAMGFDPVGLDAILDRTGLDTATAQARLLELELDGRIERLPGGRYQRRARA